jgi:virulence factor Mce-like protein
MAKSRTMVNAVILLAFAAVCIGAMEWLAFNIGQGFKFGLPDNSYQLSGYFQDADGLPTAADVRVAGLVVGKVTGIGSDASHPGTTKVSMEITDSKVSVHTNAFAKVRPKTLLGEKYVDLDPGTGDHDVLPTGSELTNTATTVENDTVFNAFDTQTRQQEQKVIQELDQGVTGRSGDVQAILPQLDTVVRDLAPVAQMYEKDNPVVDQIFTNVQTVMQTLADEHTQLASFLSDGNQALGAIADRDSSLIATLQQVSQFDQRLNTVVTATVADQQAGIDKLTPAIDSQHAFIASIIYPQAACHNQPCGLLQVLTGTLLGQLNYPNDQLTVTGGTRPCGPNIKPDQNTCEGETVTNEWASMFSVPTTAAQSTSNPATHSALNIVLSEGCDTIQTTLSPITGISQVLQNTLSSVCGTLAANHATGTSTTAASTTSGPVNGATASVVPSLERSWS